MSQDSDKKKEVEKYYTSPPPRGPKPIKFKGRSDGVIDFVTNASDGLFGANASVRGGSNQKKKDNKE